MSRRIDISRAERLILLNQYKILELLARAHPDVVASDEIAHHDAQTYHWYQTILEQGSDLLTSSEIFNTVPEPDLTPQEEIEILEVLVMYSDLQHSFKSLDETGHLEESDLDFPGWDGNSLKGELWFADTFCYREGDRYSTGAPRVPKRFEVVKPSPAHNSHFDPMPKYRRMLAVYDAIQAKILRSKLRNLTLEEIVAVLEA